MGTIQNNLTIENPYTLEQRDLNRTTTGFRLYRKPKNLYETYRYDNFPYFIKKKFYIIFKI